MTRSLQQADVPNAQVRALLEAAVNLQNAGEMARSLDVLQLARTKAPDVAYVHLLLGLTLMEQGEQAKAEASLRQALAIAPTEKRAMQALGLLLLQRGELQEAGEVLQAHLAVEPDNLVTLRAVSNILWRLGLSDEALALLEKHWQTSQSVEAAIEYVRLLANIRQVKEARELLKKIVAQFPHEMAPQYELFELALYQDDLADAKTIAQDLVDKYLREDKAWRALARAESAVGALNQALDAIDHALAIDARNPRNWLEKSEYLHHLGRHEEALDAARAGIMCGGGDVSTGKSLNVPLRLFEAISLLNLQLSDQGVALLTSLRRDYPGNSSLVRIEYETLVHLQRYEDALNMLDDATSYGHHSNDLPPMRYEVLHRLGRAQEAWEYISPLLSEKTEQRLELITAMALRLYLDDEVMASRGIFTQLTEFAPEDARFLCNLGFLLIGDGEYERSIQILAKACESTSDDDQKALIQSNLGYLYLILGDYVAAADQLTRALAHTNRSTEAIQRVAYYADGKVNPGYSPYPKRFLSISFAAKANQITLALANGEPELAAGLASELVREAPREAIAYEMAGWIHWSNGELADAREAWEFALSLAESTESLEEREVYAEWLSMARRSGDTA
jgi:tetratricopeptide (TPR) repeat protein